MLYCTVNPDTDATVGKLKDGKHEFAGAVMTGAEGNMTTLTELLDPHDPLPVVPAEVLPHAAAKTYLACTV